MAGGVNALDTSRGATRLPPPAEICLLGRQADLGCALIKFPRNLSQDPGSNSRTPRSERHQPLTGRPAWGDETGGAPSFGA